MQKLLKIFSKKSWRISDINVWNYTEPLTNNMVSFEQPDPWMHPVCMSWHAFVKKIYLYVWDHLNLMVSLINGLFSSNNPDHVRVLVRSGNRNLGCGSQFQVL